MAKKKVAHSHQDKSLQKHEDFVKPHQGVTPAMDSEASEKLESLKSLNQMLLKEAVERRQQVDSLIQSKGSLEMDLTRSNSESEALKSELAQLGEKAAELELERTVVSVFVAAQVGLKGEMMESRMKGLEVEIRELKRVVHEKESEIGRLNGKLNEVSGAFRNEKGISQKIRLDRDVIKDKLDRQIEEAKGLKQNFIELEKRKKSIEKEIGELRVSFDAVVGEKEEREMRIESLRSEKDSVERSLVQSNKLIEEMKDELNRVVNEKKGIEEEKNVEMLKRQELENTVSQLNELVAGFQKDEQKLRANVAELEKKCIEGGERQKEMDREIDQLLEEKKLSEKRIEDLVDMKSGVEKDLNEKLKQLDEQKRKIEEMVNEKNVVMEAKSRVDKEVVALQKKVAGVKAVVLKLEESSRAEVEKIKSLESEVGEYKCKLEQMKAERDEMENHLEEEKVNSVKLKAKIGELEKKVKESLKAIEETKAKNAAIFADKVEFESLCEKLKKEITSLENTINEARNELDSMKGKLELAGANSEQVLNMLKETASSFCSKDDEKQIHGEEEEEKALKGYVMELKMIKNAFKNKERQVELLQSCVEDAQKKKSFWTVLSSATTLLAAISLAYVARGH